jgi:hypothetical protein
MKRVSHWWIALVWILPDFLVPLLPTWVTDNIERAVYDGYTRDEWFTEQVRQVDESMARARQVSSAIPETK